MANAPSNRTASWLRCSDDSFLEPLDLLHLMFPNKGRDSKGDNVCFVPKPFTFQPLRDIFPSDSEFFKAEDLVDSIIVLSLLCCVTTAGIIALKLVWERVDPRFAAINPPHKKWYVAANISKVFYLALMSFSSRYARGVYNCMFLDLYPRLEVKRSGHMYIATDLVALALVPKLPFSTVMHHVTTTALMLMVSGVNLQLKGWTGLLGVSKMCLFYGMCSSYAYLVNAFLALRVVYPISLKSMEVLCKLSLWIYLACCAVNWSVHLYWLGGLILQWELSLPILLYTIPIANMMNDDIKLIRWLINLDSPMAGDGKKKN